MRRGKSSIVVLLTASDRDELTNIAKDWDLAPSDIIRRMARMLITEKITVEEILPKPNLQSIDLMNNIDYGRGYTFPVGTLLAPSDKTRLAMLARIWGFNISQLLRNFVHGLVTGDIPKIRLWE